MRSESRSGPHSTTSCAAAETKTPRPALAGARRLSASRLLGDLTGRLGGGLGRSRGGASLLILGRGRIAGLRRRGLSLLRRYGVVLRRGGRNIRSGGGRLLDSRRLGVVGRHVRLRRRRRNRFRGRGRLLLRLADGRRAHRRGAEDVRAILWVGLAEAVFTGAGAGVLSVGRRGIGRLRPVDQAREPRPERAPGVPTADWWRSQPASGARANQHIRRCR